MIVLEETLKAGDIPADLKPHLVWGEVLEGTRKRLVFMQAVREDSSLVGKTGTKISVPIASQLSASTITESTLDSSGFTFTDKTITDVDVTIGNMVYCAVKLSDILQEDVPDIDWVRLMLRNMGAAIAEYIDGAIRDALIAGAGTTITAATAGTLAYGDIVKAVSTLKKNGWFPEEGNPPLLFIHPDQEADLLKDTLFVETARYTAGSVERLQGEVAGRYAGCRVLVTDNMTAALALVVMPPNHRFGPSTIFAWKRKLRVKSDREEAYERTIYIATARYGIKVVQSSAIVLISNC